MRAITTQSIVLFESTLQMNISYLYPNFIKHLMVSIFYQDFSSRFTVFFGNQSTTGVAGRSYFPALQQHQMSFMYPASIHK